MQTFPIAIWILLGIAMLCCSMGFKKYIWFISIGYGFAIAGIGLANLIIFRSALDIGTIILNVLLFGYGCRLGGYLLYRELKMASYNKNMVGEIKDGSDMKMGPKIALWVSTSILYLCETAPVIYRLSNGIKSDAVTFVGAAILVLGIVLESASDLQKSAAKKKNPNRWCDEGLFKMVRCPNYFGEMLIWTGVLVSGVTAIKGAGQWIVALLGYLGIVYIMFSGARRLEIRQNKRYGKNPEYQKYVKTVPILVPLLPIYSVEKHKWLVG